MSYKDISKDFLIKEYIKNRISAKNISNELSCGETTIFRALEFHNIKRRTSKENQNPLFGKEPSREELKELHYDKHLSINEIAKRYNTSWGNIRKLFNEYGLRTKSHDEIIRPRDYIEPSKEELKRWYYEENLTTTQIGERLGMTSATIRKLLIKKGILLKKTIKDKKPAGFWTKERIKNEILSLHKQGEELSARFCSINRGKLFKAALTYFGDWKSALESVDIDYNMILKQKKWTKQQILEEILNLQKKGIDLSHKNVRNIRPDIIFSAERHFKKYANAVIAVGIDYYGKVAILKNKYWTKKIFF